MNNPFNWICPFCSRPQTVTSNAAAEEFDLEVIRSKYALMHAKLTEISCSNPTCRELYLRLEIFDYVQRQTPRTVSSKPRFSWQLRPDSVARALPDYIPEAISQDYQEACRIRDLSPKASATLARRCLQGMIRDFCGIAKATLFAEIIELRSRVESGTAPRGVEPDTIDAIDHIRKLGNIGAHMEKDISLIVDIDQDEAQHLIGLLEVLFDEWYVARETRKQRLLAIGVVAAEKQAIAEQKKLPAPDPAD